MSQERFLYSINKEMLQTAKRQFCLDTCLDWQQYLAHPNEKIYIQKTQYAAGTSFPAVEGARCYEGKDSFFKAIMCMGQLFLSVDEQIYDWAVEQFGNCTPEWFCEYSNLRKIDEKLGEYGRKIADTHIYYLPAVSVQEDTGECQNRRIGSEPARCQEEMQCLEKDLHRCWYNQQEILCFREQNQFTSAICFSKTQPDMLAVAAIKQGDACSVTTDAGEQPECFEQTAMAGMAGASEDGVYLWQIGINVRKEYAGRGLATELVQSIKNEIIRRGKVPFYGTSESHTISQTVALKSGFVPAWTEIYVCRS